MCVFVTENHPNPSCVHLIYFGTKITPLLVIFFSQFFFEEINFLNDLMLISDQISYRQNKQKKSWFNHFNLFCYLIIFLLWIYNLPSRPHALLFIIIMGGFVSFFFVTNQIKRETVPGRLFFFKFILIMLFSHFAFRVYAGNAQQKSN